MKFDASGVQRLVYSFRYAGWGFWHCLRREQNFRIHLVAAGYSAALAAALRISRPEWALLLLTVCFVLAREMINTAIEALVDLASPELHPLAKIAKDVAAGAVLISAAASVGVGLLLFCRPELPELLKRLVHSPAALSVLALTVGAAFWFIFYAGENKKS